MSEFKDKVISVVEYFVHYLVFLLVVTGIHEYFHLVTLRMLGGDGYIKLTWYGGACVPTVLPERGLWLFYLSGGAFTALVLFLLSWLFENEIEERCAVLPFLLNQSVYSILEATLITRLPRGEYLKIAMLVGTLTHSIGVIIGFLTLLEHILGTEVLFLKVSRTIKRKIRN